MNKITLQKLSKEVSYALRHAPRQYGLELDSERWVDVELLLEALHKNEFWKNISMKDLEEMIRASDKKGMRFVMVGFEHFMVTLHRRKYKRH